MSQNSQQTLVRLLNGERATWGLVGPFFQTTKPYPSARDYDINLRSAKSLQSKGLIVLEESDGYSCMVLTESGIQEARKETRKIGFKL